MKKFFKYLFFIVLAIIVAKWIIIYIMPSSSANNFKVVKQISYNQGSKKIKEVDLSLDLKALRPRIEREYQLAQQDIDNYINDQIYTQKNISKYRLTEEDGFLDWLFGYFTGWKMMWKKLKGLLGSSDNEIKLVSDKFQKSVINPGLNEMYIKINSYADNRMQDYYKNVVALTIDYINKNITKLKQEGYTNIMVDKNSIPWSQYIVARGGDVLMLDGVKGIGIGMGAIVGKYVGAKVAAIMGPKLLGILEAKTASIIAGKIASMFELILAPIFDYAANEAVKVAKYDETKKSFEGVIDSIFNEIEKEIKNNSNISLLKVKNSIYQELNKQVIIRAKEIK